MNTRTLGYLLTNKLTNVIITFSECLNLQLILNDDVLSKQESRQGIYQYNGIVNGNPSWKSEDHAIWFYPVYKEWVIGLLEDIGTAIISGISSAYSQDIGILDVPNNKWIYDDGGDWKDVKSGDLTLRCISGKIAKNV